MNKTSIIIEKFNYLDNYYEIIDKNNKKFYLQIKNGSINCDILTKSNKNVGFQYLDENDLIKIYFSKINNKKIIKKILINDKYKLLLDSDDEIDIDYK